MSGDELVRTVYRELARTRTPEEALRATARVLGRDVHALPRTRAARKLTPPVRPSGDACKRGHELAGENVIVRKNGTRACRACHRERVRAFDRKRVRCRSRGNSRCSRCKCRGAA